MIVAKYQGKKIPKSYFVEKSNLIKEVINVSKSALDKNITLNDAKFLIANIYGFDNWEKLEQAINDSKNIEV